MTGSYYRSHDSAGHAETAVSIPLPTDRVGTRDRLGPPSGANSRTIKSIDSGTSPELLCAKDSDLVLAVSLFLVG